MKPLRLDIDLGYGVLSSLLDEWDGAPTLRTNLSPAEMVETKIYGLLSPA